MEYGLEENAEEGVGDDGEECGDFEDKAHGQCRGGEHALKWGQQRLGGLVDPHHDGGFGRGTKELEEDAQREEKLDDTDNNV